MKSLKAWVEALHIEPSEVDKWIKEAPSPEVLTFWSLDRGKIDPAQYFEWAKNHYGLAQLKSDFFKRPANIQLWTQMESVANWSPHMMPVHEWDGVIYVACVEPDVDIKWSFPVQYVLATPAELKSHWELLNSAEPVATPISEKPSAPEIPDVPEGVLDVPEVVASEEAPDVPEGITFDFETNETDEPVSEDDLQTSPGDSPIGLSDEAPSAPVLQLDNLMPAQEEAAADEPKAEETGEEPPAEKPVVKSEPVTASEMSDEITQPKIPTSSTPASQSTSFTATHEITRVAGVLDHLKADFEGSILLTMDGGQLKPLVWDSRWKPKDNSEGPENLNDASAFRVVVRTMHPYLGHVVDTPVNRKFFEAWSINEFPEKILVQPVKDEDQLIAVMVCICNPGVKNQVLLNAGTRHAKEIIRMLNAEPQASAA